MLSGMNKEYENQLVNHDVYTYKHCKNVGNLMKAFATWLQTSPEVIKEAYVAGTWHDIGKLWIPQQMLQKKDKLNEHEWRAIKEHPYLGSFFLGGHVSTSTLTSHILYHHERYDGQGYPQGLKEEEIPLISRMLAVCEAFDAMVSERPYRRAMTTEEALLELQKNTGSQFDPKLANSFSQWVQQHYKSDESITSPYSMNGYLNTSQEEIIKFIDDEVENILMQLPQWLEQNGEHNNN